MVRRCQRNGHPSILRRHVDGLSATMVVRSDQQVRTCRRWRWFWTASRQALRWASPLTLSFHFLKEPMSRLKNLLPFVDELLQLISSRRHRFPRVANPSRLPRLFWRELKDPCMISGLQ